MNEELEEEILLAKNNMTKEQTQCKYCKDLSEMAREYPDGAYHGAILYCDECEAEYWEEFGGKISACDKQAKLNHPELELLDK